MGAAAAPGMAGTEPGAHRLHYRTEPERLDDPTRAESRALVSRRDVSPSAFAASLGSFFVSVSRPLSSSRLRLFTLATSLHPPPLAPPLPPLASDPPSAYLSFTAYSLPTPQRLSTLHA